MLCVLLVTDRPEGLRSFMEALSSDPEVRLALAASAAGAVEAVREKAPQLAIVDWELPDATSLGVVRDLLAVNPFVNTAVISPLPDDAFHEASEGLGVLGRLPPKPGKKEAAGLLRKLRAVLGALA